jgi:hypothetical protein
MFKPKKTYDTTEADLYCTLCSDHIDYCECRRCEECEELSLVENEHCTKCGGEFY